MRKVLSIVLCFILMISVFAITPFTASAYETDIASIGDCTWSLSGGTLTISGTGSMQNYETRWWGEDRPWYDERQNITNVIIENGVTSIGECAFAGCSALKSITIPKSVTRIAGLSFADCTQLESVYIEDMAAWCSIDFPTTSYINYPNGNPLFYGGKLYLNNTLVENLTVPQGVTAISKNAFYKYTSLKRVTLPEGLTEIGYSAFLDCSNIESISIPSTLVSINYRAFSGCDSIVKVLISNLASWCGIDFKEGEVLSSGWGYGSNPLSADGAVIYINNSPMTEIVIPEGVTEIKARAFDGCESLTSVDIPSSVTSIGKSAFSDCTGISSVNIPSSVTSIGEYAFYCPNLDSVYISDLASWCNIEYSGYSPAFSNNYDLYLNNKLITELTIPDSVIDIKRYTFYSCKSLTKVNIPSFVASISSNAFYSCSSLEAIYVNNNNANYSSYGGIVYNKSLTSIIIVPKGLKKAVIPNTVKNIDDYAFAGCTSLTDVAIGRFVENIGSGAFSGCSSLTEIVIPSSVKSIKEDAFSYCSNLESITIPDSVTNIDGYAFYETAWYDKQPDGLVYAGRLAYQLKGECPSEVIIKDGTVSLNRWLFDGCANLTSVTIPNTVTDIKWGAFDGCTGLTNITIPNSVKNIENYAFYGCTGINLITIPYSVTNIGEKALGYYSNWGWETKTEGFTICGYDDTEAQRYSNSKGFAFVSLGKMPNSMLGDANGDDDIDTVDVTLIQRYLADMKTGYTEDELMRADVDGSEELEITDATMIQRWLADMHVPYPIGE